MFSNYQVYDREQISLHCVYTLLSPLSHIGEVSGNVSNLKTLKVTDLEGKPRECFVYSGNAQRNGILRRIGISRALEALGLQVNRDVHHTLFAGGRIDGSIATDLDLDLRLRQLMPWLSVLGTAKPVGVFGSKSAQMVQGRLHVGSAYLVCYESAEYIYNQFPALLPVEVIEPLQVVLKAKAERFANPFQVSAVDLSYRKHIPAIRKILRSYPEWICVDQTTRRDSTHDPNLQRFLPSPEGQLSLIGTEPKKEKEKEKKSDQMIASDRLISQGAKLYSRWDFKGTKTELGFVVDALLGWSESPYLGGKGNRGNGLTQLQVWFKQGDQIGLFLDFSQGVLGEVAQSAHAKYSEYLQVYREFLEQSSSSTELKGFLQ